jgi:hypothetical protein
MNLDVFPYVVELDARVKLNQKQKYHTVRTVP